VPSYACQTHALQCILLVVKNRIFSIDIVRGLAIVVMALDHTRDYFSSGLYNPTNLAHVSAGIFLARWVTDFCAPAFIFLAGTSAFLFKMRGRTKPELAFFLLTRGAWLIILEFTLIQWGWTFTFDYYYVICQVMWAIGWSMIVLSGLIFLPMSAILAISIVMIAGHNLLDSISVNSWGRFGWLWEVLHVPSIETVVKGAARAKILYPLIPWVGVMGLGYGMGPIFLMEQKERKKRLLKTGIAVTIAFILIRAINVYGDSYAWSVQKNALYTFLSFIDCTKYPPSVLYLLMTLGPIFILLAAFDVNETGPVERFLLTFGRVPMFFYILHVPAIHALSVLFAYIKYGHTEWLFGYNMLCLDAATSPDAPAGYGYNLPILYIVWIGVVAMLFPFCRWYGRIKKNHPEIRLLSYF